MGEHSHSAPDPRRSGEAGQTAVEYAAVLLLVAVVLTTALALGLTDVLDAAISAITDKL